jgi:hypothetical protein
MVEKRERRWGKAYSDGGQLGPDAVRPYVRMTRRDQRDVRGFWTALVLLCLAAFRKKDRG